MESETIDRQPLPPTPPSIRAHRNPHAGPPPPRAGTSMSTGGQTPPRRSPQASANPVELLGPAGAARSTSSSTKKAVVVVAVIVIAAIVASGFIFVRAFANTTLLANLDQGDCVADFFNDAGEGEYTDIFLVDTIPCSEPHALEVYAVTDLLFYDEAFPGLDETFATGQDWCFTQYDQFVGGDYYVSDYEVWTIVPDGVSWNRGDRTVHCLVGAYDQFTLTTGTLEGADR